MNQYIQNLIIEFESYPKETSIDFVINRLKIDADMLDNNFNLYEDTECN